MADAKPLSFAPFPHSYLYPQCGGPNVKKKYTSVFLVMPGTQRTNPHTRSPTGACRGELLPRVCFASDFSLQSVTLSSCLGQGKCLGNQVYSSFPYSMRGTITIEIAITSFFEGYVCGGVSKRLGTIWHVHTAIYIDLPRRHLEAKECALVHLCSSQAPLALSNWWWCYSCKEARLYERLSVKAAVWRPHAERYRDFLVP